MWGDYALWTRPETKADPVSYEVPPPSAAAGVLEAIYWHPGMRYRITRIELLQREGQPRGMAQVAIRRNETTRVVPGDAALRGETLDTTEHRAQRSAVFLRDVAYRIHADIDIRPSAVHTVASYRDQFDRRAARGACFTQPYLGTRECVADFGPPDDTPLMDLDLDLGRMPLRAHYNPDGTVARWEWMRGQLRRGVLLVPAHGDPQLAQHDEEQVMA